MTSGSLPQTMSLSGVFSRWHRFLSWLIILLAAEVVIAAVVRIRALPDAFSGRLTLLEGASLVGLLLLLPVLYAIVRARTAQKELHLLVQTEHEALRVTRTLLDSTAEGIYAIDRDGVCTMANRAAGEVLGYSPQDLVGQGMHELIHHTRADGSAYPVEECPIYEAMKYGETRTVEDEPFWRKDGSAFSAAYSSAPITSGDDIEGAVVSFRNIDERKHMEHSIKEAEQQTRRFMDDLPLAVFVLDEHGRPVYSNRASAGLLGLPDDPSLEGDDLSAAYHVYVAGTDQPYPTERLPILRALAGETVTVDDMEVRRSDGSVAPLEVWSAPIRDDQGSIRNAVAVFSDVSARKAAAAELEEQADMLDLVEDAVIALDPSGRISYWNQTAVAIYGWTKEEALGRVAHELLRTTFPKPREEIKKDVTRSGRWEGELVHLRKDGSEVVVASRWLLRRDEKGRPLQILEVNNDITAQKETEERLKEAKEAAVNANQAKSEFLSRMSHELRTPLNAVLGFAQLLELDELTPEQRASTAQIIKGGRRLLELIDEVLDIARIESGRLRLSLEPVLICDLIDECVALTRPLADERSITVHSECTDHQQHAWGDRHRLGQVLLNLVSNGIKYNVPGGAVTITCTPPQEGRIRVGVTDTGSGIPREKLPLLFTPFERLGAEQSTIEGTGLGLALSKNLVEAMGGAIYVDTMNGNGMTFWIELRTADEIEIGNVEEEHEGRRIQPERVGRVLYIEDNLANLKLIERLLERWTDMELISAMSGALGLELARQHLPDLVILDLGLPDIRGDEILARLRKDPYTAHVPVVILSADATPGEIKRLLAAGAADYLTKPIDVAMFMRRLGQLLNREVDT